MPGKPRRRGRRGKSASTHHGRRVTAESHETSVPTGRQAYTETRRWLLEQHGPICAYCGVSWPARTMTLDHVTPRKGQTAYDRRDNLVLACKRCNAAKADKPFLAFLFAQRARARNLLRYGEHLSEGILELCRQLAAGAPPPKRVMFGLEYDDDNESPYADG